MPLLHKFIEQHYSGFEKTELDGLLKKYGIDVLLIKLLHVYEKQLSTSEGKDIEHILPIAAGFASAALIAINQKIAIVRDSGDRTKIRKVAAGMGLRLFISFIRQFPNDASRIVKMLGSILQTTCSLMGYNYKRIQVYFNPEQLEFLIPGITRSNAMIKKELSNPQIPKGIRLIWTEKAILDYLCHELKCRNWIKNQAQWSSLLDPMQEPGVVQWNEKHKAHLAYLLFSLYECDYIRPVGTKGYFTIAQIYIRDYSGKPFAINSLKKLSSKIKLSPCEYPHVIEEVTKVINSITLNNSPYAR